MLSLVPTPVGHLQDITLRALEILKGADVIFAEDTRHTRNLCLHYQIHTPLESFHQHNEHQKLEDVISQLRSGRHIAMVTDAGTPGISDPGFLLVRRCREENLPVQVLPGPTALIPAVVTSGFPCNRFHFEGFLPPKKGRQTRWKFLADYPFTFVLYESPHRLLKTIEQLNAWMPGRQAAVVRELSKVHEEVTRGTAAELLNIYRQRASVKGEIVLVVAPQPELLLKPGGELDFEE